MDKLETKENIIDQNFLKRLDTATINLTKFCLVAWVLGGVHSPPKT